MVETNLTFICSPCFLLILGAMGCTTPAESREAGQSPQIVQILGDVPIAREYRDCGYIRVAVRESPLGSINFPTTTQLVVLVANDVELTVNRIADLDRFIEIKEESDALAYVRVLTDPSLVSSDLPEWYGWEIQQDGHLRGMSVAVPQEAMEGMDWHAPSVWRDGDDWIVRRFVLEPTTLGAENIVRVEEMVGANGNYRLMSRVVLRPLNKTLVIRPLL